MQLIDYRDEERSRSITTIIVPDTDMMRVKLDVFDRYAAFEPIKPGPKYISEKLIALEVIARRLAQQKEEKDGN